MSRVLNRKRCSTLQLVNAVYIGRPSKWGNPFEIGRDGTRRQVITRYSEYVCDNPTLLAALPELAGKDLVCWCAPKPCHGDVLLDLVAIFA